MSPTDIPPLCRRQDLEVSRLVGRDALPVYRVVDPATGEVFELGEDELHLFHLIDGTRTVEAICRQFQGDRAVALTPEDLEGFCAQMQGFGLLVPCGAAGGAEALAAPSPPVREGEGEDIGEGADGRHRSGVSLFNPNWLLGALARLLYPLRAVAWLLVPGVPLAFAVLIHNQPRYLADLTAQLGDEPLLATLFLFVLSLFAVNLISRLMQGIVARHYGASVPRLGIRLAFGFRPRFFIDKREIWQLLREGRLWAFATPLLTRLGIFVVGTLVWSWNSHQTTTLAGLALVTGHVGLGAFLFTANPLWRADGYAWLITYLEMPRLRERAFHALGMVLRRRRLPALLKPHERAGLLAYGVATVVFVTALVGTVLLMLATQLEAHFQGTGVVLFLLILAVFLRWALLHGRGRRLGQGRAAAGASAPEATAVPARPRPPPRRGTRPSAAGPHRVLGWPVVLVVLGLVGMLPYNYEVGGEATVLPSVRAEARARATGGIVRVLVKEGDRVETAQVLAELDAWEQNQKITLLEHELAQKRAELDLLLAGSKPEEVRYREEQVRMAQVRADNSAKVAEVIKPGFDTGSVAALEYQRALGTAQVDQAAIAVEAANLALVKAPPLDSAVAVHQAAIRQLEQQLAFERSALERTRVLAPVTGRLVTPSLQEKLGSFVREGDLFSTVEDARVTLVEIQVPETDIGEVVAGAGATVRVWSEPHRTFHGQVVSIAPTVDASPESPFVKVVRVRTEIDNAEGLLRSEMTGYAKIAAGVKPAAVAYTRAIVRFFLIEVWSWLP
jgi:multidrug resistance efflux pump